MPLDGAWLAQPHNIQFSVIVFMVGNGLGLSAFLARLTNQHPRLDCSGHGVMGRNPSAVSISPNFGDLIGGPHSVFVFRPLTVVFPNLI
jgi:hypothetical protein